MGRNGEGGERRSRGGAEEFSIATSAAAAMHTCVIPLLAGAPLVAIAADYGDYGRQDVARATGGNNNNNNKAKALIRMTVIDAADVLLSQRAHVVAPQAVCVAHCSGHGTCSSSGVCLCAAGFGGLLCNVPLQVIRFTRQTIPKPESRHALTEFRHPCNV